MKKASLYLLAFSVITIQSCKMEPTQESIEGDETSYQSVEKSEKESPKVSEEKNNQQADRCSFEIPQEGRSEPKYVNLKGYLHSSPDTREMDRLPSYPWNIKLMKQTGIDLWEKGDETLPNRTHIEVKEQYLRHEGHGRYDGLLKVKNLENGQEYFVDHHDFVPVKYWKCDPHIAVRHADFIAEVKQGTKPIDDNGKWEEMGNENRVFCNNFSPERIINNGVECYMYKEFRNGYGGVKFIFPSDSLTILY